MEASGRYGRGERGEEVNSIPLGVTFSHQSRLVLQAVVRLPRDSEDQLRLDCPAFPEWGSGVGVVGGHG